MKLNQQNEKSMNLDGLTHTISLFKPMNMNLTFNYWEEVMNNKMPNMAHFKVECINNDNARLTLGKEYEVLDVENFTFYVIENDNGALQPYSQFRFNTVENTPKEKQQDYITLGSKVWVVDNGNVTVDTIVEVWIGHHYCYETERAFYDKDGFVLMGGYSSARIFLINETNQKALQVVYPQLTFEIPKEKSLAEKRYDVIKKLYDNGKVVAIKHSDEESDLCKVGILTALQPLEVEFPYVTFGGWRYACAIDLDGNEITEVSDE